MNNVVFTGRTTNDIELKQTQSGKTVCSFTLAVKRPFSKDTTDFIDMVAWEKTAELLASMVKKGTSIAVKGHLETRMWEKDGQKRKATEIMVEEFEFLEKKAQPTEESDSATPFKVAEESFIPIEADEDLPF